MKVSKKKKMQFFAMGAGTVLAIVLLIFAIFGSRTKNCDPMVVYLDEDASTAAAKEYLDQCGVKPSGFAFKTIAMAKNRGRKAAPFRCGRYVIEPHTTVFALVRKMANGQQDPMRLTLKKYRTKEQLAAYVGAQLRMAPEEMLWALCDEAALAPLGLNSTTVMTIFIPNTYEVYWTISPEALLKRMRSESDKFWTGRRKSAAEAMGMTTEEVVVLASIVEEETNKNDEKPLIASVYLNRLRKGMRLQACPTICYMNGYRINRVLMSHIMVDSPYNTYKYKGIPPGAICNPGFDSLSAAIYPDNPLNEEGEPINAYFFVSNKAGVFYYAETSAGHEKNKLQAAKDNANYEN